MLYMIQPYEWMYFNILFSDVVHVIFLSSTMNLIFIMFYLNVLLI